MTILGNLVLNFKGMEYVNRLYGPIGSPTYGKMYSIESDSIKNIVENYIAADVSSMLESKMTSIVLKDYFPSDIINNCTISNITASRGTVNSSTLSSNRYITWNIGTLPEGNTATLDYKIKVNNMENSPIIGKTVSTNEKVDCSYNDYSNTPTSTTLTTSPSIKLIGWEQLTYNKKSNITSGRVVEGQIVTYTLTLSNAGNINASALIKDTVPSGTTFVNNSIKLNGSSTSYTSQNLADGITVTVPKRGSCTLTFEVTVNKLSNGTKISNIAKFIDKTDNPSNPPEVPSNEVVLEYSDAVISHTKTATTQFNKDYVVKGEKITYSILVSNSGYLAKDVLVKDDIPTGTTFVDGSIKINGTAATKGDGTPYSANDLQSGIVLPVPAETSNQTVSFEVTVNDLNAGDKITNVANVDGKPTPDPVTYDYREAIISKTKSSRTEFGKNYVVKDEKITYTILVSNSGNLDKNVLVKDNIPTGTTFVTNSIKINGLPATKSDGTPYTANDLQAGIVLPVAAGARNQSIGFEVIVNDLEPGTSISNTADVDGSPTPDPTTYDYREAIITHTKTATTEFNKGYVVNGEKITYTILVSNSGNLDKDVLVKDNIPTGTTFVTNSIKINGLIATKSDGTPYNASDLQAGIVLPVAANAQNQSISFEVTANDLNARDKITNVANVDGTPTPDPVIHDYYESVITHTKTATTEFNKDYVVEGEKITYTILVSNSGNLDKDVLVKDNIPIGTTFANGSIKINSLPAIKDDGTPYTANDLQAGIVLPVVAGAQNQSISFEVTVNDLNAGDKIINVANVDGTPTPDPVTYDYFEAVISHTKTAITEFNKDYVVKGEKITYTILVSNSGNLDKDVLVKDNIPTGTTFVDGSIKINSLPATKSDGTPYNAADLQSGIVLPVAAGVRNQSVSFEVTVNDLNAGDKIINVADVDGTLTPDPVTYDYFEAVISHTKTAKTEFNKDYVVKGEKITYSILVSNTGNLNKDVLVKDNIPTGTTFVDGSIKINSLPATKSDGTPYNAADLQAGIVLPVAAGARNQLVSFEVIVNELKPGTSISNTANVDEEPTKAPVIYEYCESIISHTKTAITEFNRDYVVKNEKITYIISISNSGNLAKDVLVQDTIPNGTSFIEGSIKVNDKAITKPDGSNYNSNDLQSGITLNIDANTENTKFSFDVIVTGVKSGATIENAAIVDGTLTSDPVIFTYLEPIIDQRLEADTEHNKDYVVSGEKITYYIIITNSGELDKNVLIKDIIPNNTTFVDGSIKLNDKPINNNDDKPYNSSDLENGFTITVPAAEKTSDNDDSVPSQTILSFEVTVNELPNDTDEIIISNTANVDNTDTNTVIHTALPFNLKIDKHIKSYTIDGDSNNFGNDKLVKIEVVASKVPTAKIIVTYDLVVSNTGKLPGSAVICDVIPDGFEITSNNPDYWKKTSDGVLETTTDVINPGESKTYHVILAWKNNKNNFGEKVNKAEIVSADDGSSSNAISSGEHSKDDDISEATIIMSVKTGIKTFGTIALITISIVLLITFGIIAIKKLVLP